MNYKQSIKNYCRELGLSLVGFTKCRIFTELEENFKYRKQNNLENEFEEKIIDKRINPYLLMEDGKTIISFAFPYLFDFDKSEEIYFSKYTQGMDYHVVVSKYLEKVCDYIEKLGGTAKCFVDSNALPERHIAYLSGIGFIGKNNMLITRKYGSYVFLGEIITDLAMDADIPMQCECRECDKCLKACPTKALPNKNFNKCLSYITQKKEIEDEWLSKLNGRIFGCDTCQVVCPYNDKGKILKSNIEEFKPFDFMKDINYEELIYINKKIFTEKIKRTSCGWRGKNIIQRNAIINGIIKNKIDNLDKNKITSTYVLNYYNRLLNR